MIKLRTQQESSTHKIKSPSCFAILQEFVEKLCKGQQSVWSNMRLLQHACLPHVVMLSEALASCSNLKSPRSRQNAYILQLPCQWPLSLEASGSSRWKKLSWVNYACEFFL